MIKQEQEHLPFLGIEVTGIATATSVAPSTSVSVGGTSVMTAIDGKASPGKGY